MWNVVDPEVGIASINTSAFASIAHQVNSLVDTGMLPYSGIIESSAEDVAPGDTIEKNCYSRGGFRFIYKSYQHIELPAVFDVSATCKVLTAIARLYARHVARDFGGDVRLEVAWAVCQRAGDYGTLHNHASKAGDLGTRFSGIYYLAVPESINPGSFPDGCLHFVANDTVHYVPPVAGAAVIWPAWAIHGIHPFKGDGDRLGIAFDFTINHGS